jgi:FdhD protein
MNDEYAVATPRPGGRPAHHSVRIAAWRDGSAGPRDDVVSLEEPLEIRVAAPGEIGTGRPVSVTMRTPGDDLELAIGFLFGEGLIRQREDVLSARHCGPTGNVVRIELPAERVKDLDRLARNFYTTSSCGVCGKASIEAVTASAGVREVTSRITVSTETICALPAALRESQREFDRTGGVHAVGLFDENGRLVTSREDVGRHNAMDKLVGAQLSSGTVPLSCNVLLLSGRASFELVQKAMMAGVPLVAAIGAPSSLAIELAEAAGICLVAFVRQHGLNVYCHGERLRMPRTDAPPNARSQP